MSLIVKHANLITTLVQHNQKDLKCTLYPPTPAYRGKFNDIVYGKAGPGFTGKAKMSSPGLVQHGKVLLGLAQGQLVLLELVLGYRQLVPQGLPPRLQLRHRWLLLPPLHLQ
jgi:hypothetical protein